MPPFPHLRRLAAALALSLTVCACSAPVKEQPRAGFISDYSRLELQNKQVYAFTDERISNYSAFIIDKPVVLFRRSDIEEERRFTDEEIEELNQYYLERMARALTEDDGYAVVTEPGEGIARLRLGITALDASIGALNITIYTKITGAGLGGAAMEAELIDSVSGEQLAAVVQWGSGSRFLLAGFTKLGDGKRQINRWAANLRDYLDEAHGRKPDG